MQASSNTQKYNKSIETTTWTWNIPLNSGCFPLPILSDSFHILSTRLKYRPRHLRDGDVLENALDLFERHFLLQLLSAETL